MDHAEVIELLELAAVEPDGLARLTAGDTAEAAAVAGHLAGCPSCAAELARTASAAATAREAIRELPDPALRERTLAFVREVGRDRSVSAQAPAPVSPVLVGDAVGGSRGTPGGVVVTPPVARRARPWRYGVGIAAVLVAAVVGFAAGGAASPPATGGDGAAIAAAQTTMHITEQSDAVRVPLAGVSGTSASGTVLYSAASGELALTVTGLAPAPSGAVYACWVEQAGQHRQIGVLYVEGKDGAWSGVLAGLGELRAGATFGVSLLPAGDSAGTLILTGNR